ncbi:hypothetical protein Stube_07860 [Streptomyces tubercidicus]|uniref:Uncharacterized protein n=1 Tax=Streptomyces tubercidicus TaxID=47759 RepID=A0A640UJ86_9ACTN|nr:hypothetical protein Stube_07860 [Streptomyces tubercidicus]
MNHEVPQPTTATRSPAFGKGPAAAPIRAAARQVSGWLPSSCSMYEVSLMAHPSMMWQTDCVKLQLSASLQSTVRRNLRAIHPSYEWMRQRGASLVWA